MGDTKIEWTDATWNPVRGCSRVSAGCQHCYAEHQALRITRFDRGRGVPEGEGAYDGLVTMTSQGPKWTGKIKLVDDKLYDPLVMKRPRRIFVNSMSDLFHAGVPDAYIAKVFAVMHVTARHTYQVLTKQAARMCALLNSNEFAELVEAEIARLFDADPRAVEPRSAMGGQTRYYPPRNVQLGVSTEDQPTADERIVFLLRTPAVVRFISAEPLLSEICLTELQPPGSSRTWIDALRGRSSELGGSQAGQDVPRLDGVIVGGESGPGSRLMKREWAQSLRDQCVAANVPFFFKQWGGTNKKEAGRLLDGREWNELPEVACAT